jgi:hypothetical protein
MTKLTYRFATDADVKAFVEKAEILLGPRGLISFPDNQHVRVSHPGINVAEHLGMWDQVAGEFGGSRTAVDED